MKVAKRKFARTQAIASLSDGASPVDNEDLATSRRVSSSEELCGRSKRRLLFVEIKSPEAYNAGKKAFDDVNTILKQAGFASILMNRNHGNFRRLLQLPVLALRLAAAFLYKRNLIVVQSPIPKEAKAIVMYLLRIARAKTVILLHDIDSMRYSQKSHQRGADMALYNSASAVIAHNALMRTWLATQGVKAPIHSLTLFDYLIGDHKRQKGNDVLKNPIWRHEIVFAGSLSATKSGFIYKIADEFPIKLRVFGALPTPEMRFPGAVRYCGVFPPGAPTIPSGLFGLVWDGPETSTCTGIGGDYLRINSPHKISLYLACGLPVLCWRESALAKYIETEHLGIVVTTLEDIPKLLEDLPEPTYLMMLKCVENVKNELQAGRHLTRALARTMSDVM